MKKRFLALMGKKNELKSQAFKITDLAIAEGRAMTADEQAEFDRISDEIKKVEANMETLASLMDDGEGVPATTPIRDGSEPEDKTKFKSFGEQLMAVRNAAAPGGRFDERLRNSASGNNEGTASDGGYLVQEEFVSELLKNTFATGLLLPKVRKIPISTNANVLKINGINETSRVDGSRWGGIQAYWEGEADQIATSKPTFNQLTLTLKKLACLCYATDELLEDAPALQAVINEAASNELAFKLDNAIINGSGVGEPLGIMNSDALVTIAKDSGQSEKLTVNNVLNMVAACYDKNGAAEWYMNAELLPYIAQLKIGDTLLYTPGNIVNGTPNGTLLGKKVNFIEQCQKLGDKGDIVLADMSQYILTDKTGINAQQSIHVRFVYDETAFRFVYRCDGLPSWASAKTPFKGTSGAKFSPFVTLAGSR